MHITVNERGGKNIHLHLPSGLVLNRLSASLLSVGLKTKNVNISGRQLRRLFRAVRSYKAAHPEWTLLEVYSHNGEVVEIIV